MCGGLANGALPGLQAGACLSFSLALRSAQGAANKSETLKNRALELSHAVVKWCEGILEQFGSLVLSWPKSLQRKD